MVSNPILPLMAIVRPDCFPSSADRVTLGDPPLISICLVRNDWPQWRDRTAADFSGMRRKVVDGRRNLNRKALEGVELLALGG